MKALTAFASGTGDEQAAALVSDCAVAAKVQFAVAHAVGFGWLTADRGMARSISTASALKPELRAAAGVLDALRLLASYDVLYGGSSVPSRCTVRAGDGFSVTWVFSADEWIEAAEPEAQGRKECA